MRTWTRDYELQLQTSVVLSFCSTYYPKWNRINGVYYFLLVYSCCFVGILAKDMGGIQQQQQRNSGKTAASRCLSDELDDCLLELLNETAAATQCAFDGDCPQFHKCLGKLADGKGRCDTGGRDHLEGKKCERTDQCPNKYFCEEKTCYANGPQHRNTACPHHSDCLDTEVCIIVFILCLDFTCLHNSTAALKCSLLSVKVPMVIVYS